MSKKNVRYLDLGRYQIPLTPEQEKVIESMKKEGETNKQFTNRILFDVLDGKLSYEPSKIDKPLEEKPSEDKKAVELPPCNYCDSIIDNTVQCSRFLKTKQKIISVPLASCIACWKRRAPFIIKAKEQRQEPTKKDEEEEEPDFSSLPKMREPTTDEIVDQIGICLNPLLIRQRDSFACVVCKKRYPQKRQACDEIVQELKMSPMADKEFIDAMIKKTMEKPDDWWQVPKSEDMTLEEIEKELGLDQPIDLGCQRCSKYKHGKVMSHDEEGRVVWREDEKESKACINNMEPVNDPSDCLFFKSTMR